MQILKPTLSKGILRLLPKYYFAGFKEMESDYNKIVIKRTLIVVH